MSIYRQLRACQSNRWIVPAECAVFAAVLLAIGLARGDVWLALAGPLIMLGYGAGLLLFGRRSEAVGLLGGDSSDERRAALQLRASAATAHVLIAVLVGGWIWAIATGSRYAGTFSALCAVAGVTFIAATVWYSRRA
jgi:hypothetical protein